jgi:hypothetical protein
VDASAREGCPCGPESFSPGALQLCEALKGSRLSTHADIQHFFADGIKKCSV